MKMRFIWQEQIHRKIHTTPVHSNQHDLAPHDSQYIALTIDGIDLKPKSRAQVQGSCSYYCVSISGKTVSKFHWKTCKSDLGHIAEN